jgi:hypothetical protein
MSTVARGRTVRLTFRDRGPSGKATLTIEISGGDDVLPHEHRDDVRQVAAEILAVPAATLKDVEVELKRIPGNHPHPHGEHDEHEHEHDHSEHSHSHTHEQPMPTPRPA